MKDLKKRITDLLSLIDTLDEDNVIDEYNKLSYFDKEIWEKMSKYNKIWLSSKIKPKLVDNDSNGNSFIIESTYNEMLKIPTDRINKLKKIK